MKKNIIEINGRRYDAVGGQPLDNPSSISGSHSHLAANSNNKSVYIIPVQSSKSRDHAHTKAPIKHPHPPQHSKTLMRRAVNRPNAQHSRLHHVQSAASKGIIERKAHLSSLQSEVNSIRLQRAHDVQKNYLVRRFNLSVVSSGHNSRTLPTQPQPAKQSSKLQDAHKNPQSSPTQILLENGLSAATSHKQIAPKIKHHQIRYKLHHKLRHLNAA